MRTWRNIVVPSFVFILVLGTLHEVAAKNFREILEQYEGKTFYLQHNLWYRDKGTIYWNNYILVGDYLPIGSKVTVTKVRLRSFKFKVEGREEKFKILMEYCVPAYEVIIQRIFGEHPLNFEGLTEIDLKGIRHGVVYEGMSRKGVLYSVGYPPEYEADRTPGSLKPGGQLINDKFYAKSYTYYKNRFDRIVFHFDENDQVYWIQN